MQSNVAEYTVSEISFALKRSVEENFGHVRVRGEISGFKRAASGHVYLALKDDKAVLDGVCWRGTAGRLSFKPEDGLEVICSGKLTTYPGRSRYQLVIEHMEPAGVGALMALLEERKKKLAAEGLFDPERKRKLPFLPSTIGIVTSPTGAVIRDILHRLAERFPCHVLVWPVIVQGEGAAEQVAAAIRGFSEMPADGAVPRPDLVIVARGGGSIEDLWAFNEEIVARAAAECTIPLISAVGHETDTTLIDHVADSRAPTPTAAAEMAVPVRNELRADLLSLGARQTTSLERHLHQLSQHVRGLARGLPEPASLLRMAEQRLDDIGERLRLRSPMLVLAEKAERLESRHARLKELVTDVHRRREQDLAALSRRLSPSTVTLRLAAQEPQLVREGKRLDEAMTRALAERQGALQATGKLLSSLSHKGVLGRGYALVRRHDDGSLVPRLAAAGDALVFDIELADGSMTVSRDAAEAEAPKPARPKPRKRNKPPEQQGTLL